MGILQKIVASWKISNRKLDKLLTFEPTIVIQDGKFLDKNLKKIRYSIDNVLQMLREKTYLILMMLKQQLLKQMVH